MRDLLTHIGFQENNKNNADEAAIMVQLVKLSGGFDEPVISALLNHIGVGEENQASIKGAVDRASPKTEGETFNAENFLAETNDPLLQRDLLAYMLSATQRFFQPQPVVKFLEETTFSKGYKDEILAFSSQMGMRDENRVNLTRENNENIDYGLCIGATSGGANDYMLRHKNMADNRPNDADPYILFMLAGSRKLTLAADNPAAPTEKFRYGAAGEERDYLTYLSEKSGVARGDLTEADMMKDRYQEVFGKNSAEAGPALVVIEAANAEEFMGAVATRLKASPDSTSKIAVLASYDIFARTYETMLNTALEKEGVAGISVKCDAEKSAHSNAPEAILKEFAKIINVRYQQVAKNLDFTPHDQTRLSGAAIKAVEESARREDVLKRLNVAPQGAGVAGPSR